MKAKEISKVFAIFMALLMVLTSLNIMPTNANAAKVTVGSVKIIFPSTKTLVIKKGEKIKINTKVTVKPNKKKNKKVVFKSSNKKAVTVSSNGILKAVISGKSIVTAISKLNKKKKASIKVEVATPVTSINLNKSSIELNIKQSFQLVATVLPKKATYKKVNYNSSDKSVAIVTTSGKIVAKKAGKTQITVSAADGSGKQATCKVNVSSLPTQVPSPADPTVVPTTTPVVPTAIPTPSSSPRPSAIPEPADTREAVMVEDFQDDTIGDYLSFTYAGRSLIDTGAKMEIVKDPADTNNKLVKITIANANIKYCGYEFAPVVSVSLGAIKACEGTTLDDYEAIRFKTRVVSNSEHTYKSAVAYFAPYKTITSKYAFSTYDDTYGKYTAEDEREDLTHRAGTYKKGTVEKRILGQFTYTNCMARSKWEGIDPDDPTKLIDDINDIYNKYMPEIHESISNDYGYSEDNHKIPLVNRTLQFNKDKMWYDMDGDDTTNDLDLTTLDAFDVVLGATYPETKESETTTWYLDDVQLIKKSSIQ